jgi:hypothetical protein
MTLLHSQLMRCAFVASCVGLLAAASCNKKTPEGLPPATDWQAGATTESGDDVMPPPSMTGHRGNPHAGLDMPSDPDDPRGERDIDPDDPHAGLDSDSDDPHAGRDVTKMGLSAPDPDRAIDPSHRIAGTIAVDAKLRERVKPGTAVFVLVKRAGADGTASGPPLAVDKLTWSGSSITFELTEAQAMVAGTVLDGDVVVTARYDQDSDAMTRQPGDVTGQIRVKLPAEHVKLVLDTLVP